MKVSSLRSCWHGLITLLIPLSFLALSACTSTSILYPVRWATKVTIDHDESGRGCLFEVPRHGLGAPTSPIPGVVTAGWSNSVDPGTPPVPCGYWVSNQAVAVAIFDVGEPAPTGVLSLDPSASWRAFLVLRKRPTGESLRAPGHSEILSYCMLAWGEVTAPWVPGDFTGRRGHPSAAVVTRTPRGGFSMIDPGVYEHIHITPVVRRWLENPASNFGIALGPFRGSWGGENVQFGSDTFQRTNDYCYAFWTLELHIEF